MVWNVISDGAWSVISDGAWSVMVWCMWKVMVIIHYCAFLTGNRGHHLPKIDEDIEEDEVNNDDKGTDEEQTSYPYQSSTTPSDEGLPRSSSSSRSETLTITDKYIGEVNDEDDLSDISSPHTTILLESDECKEVKMEEGEKGLKEEGGKKGLKVEEGGEKGLKEEGVDDEGIASTTSGSVSPALDEGPDGSKVFLGINNRREPIYLC